MSRYVDYALKRKGRYCLCLVFMLLAIAADACIPLCVNYLVDTVITEGALEGALRVLVLMASLFVLKGLFEYVTEYVSDTITAKVGRDLRSDLFSHMMRQGGAFYAATKPGELMSRIRHDSEKVSFAFGFIGVFLVQIVFHVALQTALLFRMCWQVGLVMLVAMPLMGWLAWREEVVGGKIYDKISDETVELNSSAGEAIGGIRTVKAYGKEERERRRFGARNESYYRLNVSLERFFGLYDGTISAISRLTLAVTLLIGGLLVMRSSMTLGRLAAAVEYVNKLIWPMLEIGWVVSSISQAKASAAKTDEVFASDTEVKPKEPAARREDEVGKAVEFNDVTLEIGGRKVLENVSFRVGEGRSLGIMGGTGSGKTTIVNLLTRFHEPTSGFITLGGIDIARLSADDLRRDIAVVDQDVFLFSESVRENLKKGRQDSASDEEMRKAARLAEADGFAEKLPEGYSTVIGEKGVGLSGGQKQRLVIARALLKDAPVLVFDDSTSALDMETEREIQRSMANISRGAVKITIAHRVSSVRGSDEIIYLQDGRIAERGTHDELMALKGLYRATYVAQYSRED